MGINLKVAAGGAAKQYLQDKAQEEEFIKLMRAKRSDYLTAQGEKKFKEISELTNKAKARVKKATNFGFSPQAAMILEQTGQLDSQLVRLTKEEEKGGAINRDAIATVSEFIVNSVPEDLQTDVFKYMSTGGFPSNVDELQDKFTTIMLSLTGDLDEAAKILQGLNSTGGPLLSPVEFQSRALTDMGATERNSVIKNIQATIGGYLSDTNINDSGTWVGINAGAAQRIQNEILQEYEKQRANPGYGGDIGDVLTTATQSIQRQVNTPGVTLNDVTIFNPLPPLPTTLPTDDPQPRPDPLDP